MLSRRAMVLSCLCAGLAPSVPAAAHPSHSHGSGHMMTVADVLTTRPGHFVQIEGILHIGPSGEGRLLRDDTGVLPLEFAKARLLNKAPIEPARVRLVGRVARKGDTVFLQVTRMTLIG